jgi:virginiamycin B lyase
MSDAMPSVPYGIAPGPDGNLWFKDALGRIGRITPSGEITHFPLPGDSDLVTSNGIVVGPDDNIWFTQPEHRRIDRITAQGVYTQVAFVGNDAPLLIARGPDDNLWFTERDAIGRLTPAGELSEFTLPDRGTIPVGIAAGPDGKMWFTESAGNRIGRIVP